ncbi:phosphoglycolate phosphatase [Ferroplasma sp.]|uniref:phosphoglycolate phosphatase n=1 Tax=Ferroplasma sp. TaxID=2591003 RepID=UPI0026044417|nr:phosphoglycolate phosphatase [Ferroplasma sp.]
MIKIMVLDVDGTITDQNRVLNPEAVSCIANGINNGLKFSLISGNVIPVMYGLRTFLGINGPVFGENGGIMYYNNTIEKFFDKSRPLSFLEYISKKSSAVPYFTNQWRETSAAFSMNPEDEGLVSSEAAKWDLEIVNSKFTWHIMNRGQNKGYAVEMIRKMLNIDWDEILVVGDSDNDNAMFTLPVHKACPFNATDSIKSMSDYVSKKSYGYEIKDVMNKFSLF